MLDAVCGGIAAQPKQTRKEWDLSDPADRQLPRPTRDGDHDARLGASSIQVFAGEDLRCAERRTLQKVQQAAWNQQMVPTSPLLSSSRSFPAAPALLAKMTMNVIEPNPLEGSPLPQPSCVALTARGEGGRERQVSEKLAEKVAEKEEDKAYAALLAAKAAASQSAELAKAAEARYKTFRFAAENKAAAEQAASRAHQVRVSCWLLLNSRATLPCTHLWVRVVVAAGVQHHHRRLSSHPHPTVVAPTCKPTRPLSRSPCRGLTKQQPPSSPSKQERVLDEAEKEVDLHNTHNSKLLGEANGHLRTKGGFRGFHPEELNQFREYQAVQREEAKAKAKAAVDEERAFARYANEMDFQ